MTLLRVVTDIEVGDYPTDETIAKVTAAMAEYAHGVVSPVTLDGEEKAHDRGGHVHISSESELCTLCRRHARDGLS